MKVSSAIESVADTAFWVATYRADEGKRPDALFSDPYAERLVEGRGREIANSMSGGAMTAWTVAIRTRIIDDYITEAIARGVDTILNLGAGLDTRTYRMELPSSLRWIEVDFPATIAFKAQRLREETPRCQLERHAIDLNDDVRRNAFIASVTGRVLVITEGVVPYLTEAQTSALAADLHANPCIEGWVLERYGGSLVRLRRIAMGRRTDDLRNAPFRFAPKDWDAFFDGNGFRLREVRAVGEEARRLKRPAPLPTFVRLLFRVLPKKLRMGYGYAVLEPKR